MRYALLLVWAGCLYACGSEGSQPADPMSDAGSLMDMGTSDAEMLDALVDETRQQIMNLPNDINQPLSGLSDPVYVLRTEGNIPHIYATNRHDLLRVYGYVLAADRFWMMDLGRRLGSGRLSSLFGSAVLSTDLTTRAKGLHLVGQQIWSNLSQERRLEVTAFAEGINAYIGAVRAEQLPPPSEYSIAFPLLGVSSAVDLMEDFTGRDVAAFTAVIAEESACARDEITRTFAVDDLLGRTDAPINADSWSDVYMDLFERIEPVELVRTDAPGLRQSAFRQAGSDTINVVSPSGVPSSILRNLGRRLRQTRRFHGNIIGSNAWAASGNHTVTGGPILAGDGHLELTAPPLFHQAGLDLSVFGVEDWRVRGNFLGGIPALGVGTNGKVAWSFTCFYSDSIDYYREEVVLNDDGRPSATIFDGQPQALTERVEVYQVRAAPGLGGPDAVSGEVRSPLYTLYDGRRLLAVEGRPVLEGETGIDLGDGSMVFEDVDGDGVISGISYDATLLDTGDLLGSYFSLAQADSLDSFREAQQTLMVTGSHFVAIDAENQIMSTGYHASPCRDQLPRTSSGRRFADGANPQLLLDGTRYGGFKVSLDPSGKPLNGSAGAIDCVVPYDDFPNVVSPSQGFVVSANNDPSGLSFDGSIANDDQYIGGPWDIGFRARRIDERLSALVASGTVSIETMADIQADVKAIHGIRWVPHVLEAIDHARSLVAVGMDIEDPSDARLAALYMAHQDRFEAAASRLNDWVEAGAEARSGVATFYNEPSDSDREHAVATTIFAFWVSAFQSRLLGDLNLQRAHRLTDDNTVGRFIDAALNGRGAGNPSGLITYRELLEESSLFDDARTDVIERSRELIALSLVDALDHAALPPIAKGLGGFGTEDMSTWLWGLRHLLVVDSIIAPFLTDSAALLAFADLFAITPRLLPLTDEALDADDPRKGLPGFPRPGGNFAVDSAEHGFDMNDYSYRAGPVMRMVIGLNPDGTVIGQNIIPGGQSGLKDSPHFADQLGLWLGNRAYPIRFDVSDVLEFATTKERFYPADQQP